MTFRVIPPSLACALLLSACATDGPQPRQDRPVAASLESAMTEAARATASGQQDKALGLLRNAASTYPAEKGPWLTMAQMKFDRASYGEAILAAQEALQRDPADQVGSSIIAVSGLRLSTKALADLSQQNNLSGSLRDEAQGLARMLRTSLGEDVLVPPVRASKPQQGAPVRRGAPQARPAAPSGADPFGSIR
ncbi:hypothetical protein LJR289_000574 [Pseudoduganella sp. LjRoot289]|uniref:hypothetical protein n=1 Tax=Pseudoduganella sp. LjRoot289 TaxID=3342314 RepID=UPI003ED0A5FF